MDLFKEFEQTNLFGETPQEEIKISLMDKFIVPPFSVFDTRQAYWQNRKRQWLKLGIKSELGREVKTFHMADWLDEKREQGKMSGHIVPSDTSIFDPVLCELCYKWVCINNGTILDVFSGGSVRGIVANILNYEYYGIDLSEKQILANKDNAKEILGDEYELKTHWINDDSQNVDKYIENNSVDMIFTCPPYFDLEIYSNKENDLSNMTYDNFKKAYTEIIVKACQKLKENRFAVFVVGDIRDKKGFYRDFVDLTKQALSQGGLHNWNEIIFLNGMASASIRAEKPFVANRKITKIHQNILVYYKGDPSKIKENFKEIEV